MTQLLYCSFGLAVLSYFRAWTRYIYIEGLLYIVGRTTVEVLLWEGTLDLSKTESISKRYYETRIFHG